VFSYKHLFFNLFRSAFLELPDATHCFLEHVDATWIKRSLYALDSRTYKL